MSNHTTMSYAALCASTVIILYLIRVYLRWRRLSHIPGPTLAGFTRLWMVKQGLQKRQPDAFKRATDKYGFLVRVGPNELITNNPEILKRTMAVRSKYSRGPWYTAMRFDPTRDNLLSMRQEDAHTKLRAKMAPGYSGKENESMERSVDTMISQLVQLIQTRYISTGEQLRPLNWQDKTGYFTVDVASELAFGKAFGFLETDSDVYDYIAIAQTFLPIMVLAGSFPLLAKVLQSRLMRRFLPKESDKLGFGAFVGIAKRLVTKRFLDDTSSQRDMIGSFMRHGLDRDEVAGEILLQVVAGSDTSATVLRTVMLNLLTNPSIYHKLQSEIDLGIAEGRISSPITDAEARQLPYLQAIIKEGLRIMPPAAGALFKQVPPEGDVFNGIFVPGYTQISGCNLGIHCSKEIFGVDADLFRPERWIQTSPQKFSEMASTVDLVFAYGKYHCLGRNVALMEFNKIFVELLRRFNFSAMRSDRPAKVSNSGIWAFEDFWVRVEERVS